MKMIIDFDPETNIFDVVIERGKVSGDPWPPPPPDGDQLNKMTAWLNKSYPDACKKFLDKEVSSIKITYKV